MREAVSITQGPDVVSYRESSDEYAADTPAAIPAPKKAPKICEVCKVEAVKAIVQSQGKRILACESCVVTLQVNARASSGTLNRKLCQRCNQRVREAKVRAVDGSHAQI
jgi:hypothetical protein